jgi:6,7-dimethyl-8-ribityllumazine synthase
MIKGISLLRSAGSAAAYERLSSFFSALGFAPGKGWQEDSSRGTSFLSPLGNLEFVDGKFPSIADILVEVTSVQWRRGTQPPWFHL